jgi:hypothetical protein
LDGFRSRIFLQEETQKATLAKISKDHPGFRGEFNAFLNVEVNWWHADPSGSISEKTADKK